MNKSSRQLSLALVLLSPLALAAQQSSDTIPKELVTMLLRGPGTYPGDNFDIKIGAPAGFPADLLPKGVSPAVSTTSERQVTVVAEAPQLTMGGLLAYERELTAAGWINPSSMSMRGLMSSTSVPALNVCRGDQYATLSFAERKAGGVYVRASLTSDPRRGSCVAMPRPISFFADIDLPQMPPPSNTPSMGTGSSSGSDHHHQQVRLETATSPGDIAAHYTSQLEKAGWKREARVSDDGLVAVRYTMQSRSKDTVVAILMVTSLPVATGNKQVEVSLRLLRVDPARRFPGGRGGIVMGGTLTCC
jgi:hypothetical protein